MKFKHLFVVLLAFIVIVFASCDQKKPEKGYISEDEALESSNDKNELEKMFKGIYQGSKAYYE